jgi:hypothetical protein
MKIRESQFYQRTRWSLKMKNKLLKILLIVMVSTVLLSISSYVIFAAKSEIDVKKERLEKLQTKYSDKQRKIEAEITSMPRNFEEDWKKIREAESKLKEMRMSPEADELISELSTPPSEQPKENLEKTIFYSRLVLTNQNYEGFAAQEKDPVMKAKFEMAAKIMEHKRNLLNEVEKDFKEGKGTFEELNKRIDELMKINPRENG